MVFLDEERFRQRPAAYMGIAVFFVLFVTAVVLGTGATLLLVAIDYFWNAWHFAAQHSGISRIYGRTAHAGVQSGAMLEKVLLRTFILFVIFRAGATTCTVNCEGIEHDTLTRSASPFVPGIDEATLQRGVVAFVRFAEGWLDFTLLALPLVLLIRELARFRAASVGSLVYLASVASAYAVMLLAVHFHHASVLLAVALAISLFHATEYLAIVSWAVQKKHAKSTQGFFAHLCAATHRRRLVSRWVLALLTFIVVMALGAWAIQTQFHNQWAVLTIAVSYLHYTYDGMIWKVRRPVAVA
jgi:hypothetical protein